MGLAMPGLASPAMIMAALAQAFALALGSIETNAAADLGPIGGIAGAVFGLYRHDRIAQMIRAQSASEGSKA
jgi:hypothetical protein